MTNQDRLAYVTKEFNESYAQAFAFLNKGDRANYESGMRVAQRWAMLRDKITKLI